MQFMVSPDQWADATRVRLGLPALVRFFITFRLLRWPQILLRKLLLEKK